MPIRFVFVVKLGDHSQIYSTARKAVAHLVRLFKERNFSLNFVPSEVVDLLSFDWFIGYFPVESSEEFPVIERRILF